MENKKRSYFLVQVIAMLLLVTSVTGILIPAVSAEENSSPGFSVKAILPENQISDKSYFDLKMVPGASQVLQVSISNKSDEKIRIAVSANAGFTNESGMIEYIKTEQPPDPSLKYNFSDLITLSQETVEIEPFTTKEVSFNLEMPPDLFDGVILGGLVFTRLPQDTDGDEGEGVTITNVYSYVVGVILQETEEKILPEFELVNVYPELVNFHSGLIHEIRNPKPKIVNDVTLDIQVCKENSSKVIWEKNTMVKFAPNSTMNYIMYIEDQKISPGNYISNVSMEAEGQTWEFQFPFSIAGQQAKQINEDTVQQPKQNQLPSSTIIIIAFLIILVIALLTIVLVLLKKNKKNQ